ncbi:MAG TPA: bacteriohemerythrin [Thermodesulfobacteriota bacterium]|nr:bacteriohemerythrin [Thermodesulfobacteriota bacterium]
MALIQWSNNLSVNVTEIDQQHQKLIHMINDLDDAMRQGKGKETVGKIIQGMISYTGTHFATEENFFDRFGYPDALGHKKKHTDFVKKAQEIKQKFDRGQLGLPIEVMNFLSDWLGNHIKGEDKKYTPFFNAKGLK